MNGFTGKLYQFSDWLLKLVYLNILWIIFTLMGLVVLGLLPSTVAMFTITRKWLMGEEDTPIFKTFWGEYKSNFLQANILGFILLLIGYILFIDLKFFQMTDESFLQPLYLVFVVLICIFFVILLYIFPVYVHYDFKLLAYIKYSLIAAVGNIPQTIVMITSSVIIYYFLRFIPGLIPFIGGSLISVVLMAVASRSFPKMSR